MTTFNRIGYICGRSTKSYPELSELDLERMILETIYLKDGGQFAEYVAKWADTRGIETVSYEFKPNEDQEPQGLLLVNENQDIRRDIGEIYSLFDRKHIPTQKIDINGTLQVAINLSLIHI